MKSGSFGLPSTASRRHLYRLNRPQRHQNRLCEKVAIEDKPAVKELRAIIAHIDWAGRLSAIALASNDSVRALLAI